MQTGNTITQGFYLLIKMEHMVSTVHVLGKLLIDIILDREIFEHRSILKQYDEVIELYRKYYQYDEIKGAIRETVETIPEKAFRETIANALVHRAWDVRSHIRVAMYEDRIEVFSPGGLPKGITREEYLNGQISVLRNPIIGAVFFRLNIIESFGTGVQRINAAYAGSKAKPIHEFSENMIGSNFTCAHIR